MTDYYCRIYDHTFPSKVPPGPSHEECTRCHTERIVDKDGNRTYLVPKEAAGPRLEYLRDLAVEIVDGIHGYSVEFSNTQEAHLAEYDWVEERLTAVLSADVDDAHA